MVREFFISLYLFCFKMLFNLFNFFPMKDKVVFVITFGDNSRFIYDELKRQTIPAEVVVLYKGTSNKQFQSCEGLLLIPFETANIACMIRSIYHLATCRFVLVDNYFGFLSVTNFKPNVECIQLWHASGAIKKFGFVDESIKYRSAKSQKRFSEVYKRFNKVIVGSDTMAQFFREAFKLPEECILRVGIPRTDFFFDERKKKKAITKLHSENAALWEKKKILYAPTYRDGELDHFKLQLDVQKMYQELGNDYVVLLRLHPAIENKTDYSALYPNFLFDYSSQEYFINELLLIADYLITDYSSIPYDYSLLNKPMIFFAYDLESYKVNRGLWEQYEATLPGPVAKDTDEVIRAIKSSDSNLEEISKYSNVWNRYSDGHSSKKLVEYMFGKKK